MKERAEARRGWRGVVLLTAGLVVVFVLVFLLGILVGREIATTTQRAAAAPPRAASGAAPPAAEPSAAPPKNARANMKEKLTFYQTLTSPTPDIPPPGATPSRKVVEERMVVKGPEQRSVLQPTGQSVEAPASPPPLWTVQVSSFRSRALAEDQMKRLIGKGYDAYLAVARPENGQARYRVRVGGFATRTEAEGIADQLRAELKLNPFVAPR